MYISNSYLIHTSTPTIPLSTAVSLIGLGPSWAHTTHCRRRTPPRCPAPESHRSVPGPGWWVHRRRRASPPWRCPGTQNSSRGPAAASPPVSLSSGAGHAGHTEGGRAAAAASVPWPGSRSPARSAPPCPPSGTAWRTGWSAAAGPPPGWRTRGWAAPPTAAPPGAYTAGCSGPRGAWPGSPPSWRSAWSASQKQQPGVSEPLQRLSQIVLWSGWSEEGKENMAETSLRTLYFPNFIDIEERTAQELYVVEVNTV